jgi:hypothetical protein
VAAAWIYAAGEFFGSGEAAMQRRRAAIVWGVILSVVCGGDSRAADPVRLRVSDNHRFLVHADGKPFFYLGDTAWELLHRSTREEADQYLADRAKKQFTVIQTVVLGEFDGLTQKNAYGFLPLVSDDPAKPAVKDGPNNDYWDHVDYVVDKAESLGLVVGMLPTWGDKWNKKWGAGPEVFTPENAEKYGKWIAQRYRDRSIIWILGGDRPVENDRQKQVLRAMAKGLRSVHGGKQLMTFHPTGGQSSSTPFHDDAWLDFNMRQNGHGLEYARYAGTRADYERKPIKPVIDGEPIYEGHPVAFNAKEFGHSIAADVRRPLYWDLFNGACGHTYGHHSVWQLWKPGRNPVNSPLMPWTEAIDEPGARQMQFGRRLIESRPILERVPDDELIVPSDPPTNVPGAGTRRMVATRGNDGSYAMIYVPVGRKFSIRLEKLSGKAIRAWWFDPRTGEANKIGELPKEKTHEFTPPTLGEATDWVLVLDDAAKGWGPPGKVGK